MAGRRVVEQNRRWSLAAEGPVIADVGPKPAGADFDLGEHRHGGVVQMKAFRRQHVTADFGQDSISAAAQAPTQSASVETSRLIPSATKASA